MADYIYVILDKQASTVKIGYTSVLDYVALYWQPLPKPPQL